MPDALSPDESSDAPLPTPPSEPADPRGPGGPPIDLSAEVDLGSWARFTPDLAAFLDRRARAGHGAGTDLTVLLTAPAPVVGTDRPDSSEQTRSGLSGLLRRRRRREPSPEVPGVVLVVRDEGVEVVVPVLDARGRVLLGDRETSLLRALGWAGQGTEVMSRLLPGGAQAAETVTRVLIEVLGVAHPADLDWLVDAQP